MKKIVSSIVIVCLMGVLVISNGTVEAAKKRESENSEVKIVSIEKEEVVMSVASTKKEDSKKVENKESEKIEKGKKSATVRDEKNNAKEKTLEPKLEQKEIADNKKNTNADGKVTKEDFATIVNGVRIELGTDINDIIEELGEPDNYVQARSCLHDGDDKIYTFGGITIYTYPDEKKDIVYIVEYIGEELTPAGVGVGSTMAEVEKAYGKEYVEDAFFTTYELDVNATISFQLLDDKVEYIEFYME